jgi:hypothetical protein
VRRCPASRRTPYLRLALACVLAFASVAILGPATASAGVADQSALAKRYAPVLRFVQQQHECGAGESYLPIDIDALLPNQTVALRGPWGAGDLVKIAPTGRDLAQGLYEYHLDFPGDALDPGCGYEKWSRRISEGHPIVAYAHVVTEPDHPHQLALQYWFFYVFNDWNNLHEGDWEMIQLMFDASTARQALAISPTSVGYSQHEGAERADWGDQKLELVGGTHPVVHPADGSHANFFNEALYLGASGSQGVGCDDTLGPTFDVRPQVDTIPSSPSAALAAYPWTGFQGRWGELQPAFFNGPTGPNLKTQWTKPVLWSENWRTRSFAVPAGGVLGTRTTAFFCGAVGRGSNALQSALHRPGTAVVVLALVVLLIAFVATRATWRPSAPLRLARRRAGGQILTSAARMYRQNLRLYVGIGSLFLPLALLDAGLQSIMLRASGVAGVHVQGEARGLLVLLVLALGTVLTLLAVAIVQSATMRALVELDQGRPIGPRRAYRLALERARPMLMALIIAVVVVSLLASTLILLPLAVILAIRWALIVPVTALEEGPGVQALRRSARLIGRRWPKVASLSILSIALVLVAGPVIGTLLVILTDAPLALLNVVAGVIYAVLLPFAALTTAYVYFDARIRHELDDASKREDGVLAAESELGFR